MKTETLKQITLSSIADSMDEDDLPGIFFTEAKKWLSSGDKIIHAENEVKEEGRLIIISDTATMSTLYIDSF